MTVTLPGRKDGMVVPKKVWLGPGPRVEPGDLQTFHVRVSSPAFPHDLVEIAVRWRSSSKAIDLRENIVASNTV